MSIFRILDIPLAEIEADIIFLKENNNPEEEISEKWQNTFSSRERCLKNANSYILMYRCLHTEFGHKLVISIFY